MQGVPTELSALLSVSGMALLIVVLLEIFKKTKPEYPGNWLPATAMLLGIALMVAVTVIVIQPLDSYEIGQAVLKGIVSGWTANGVYDNLMAHTKGKPEPEPGQDADDAL